MSAPGIRMDPDAIRLTSRAAMDHTIASISTSEEAFRVPMLRAARDGAIALLLAKRTQVVPRSFFHLPRPKLLVFMDDTPEATGPDAWPQARKALRWAHSAVLHAAAGKADEYALIAAATLGAGRLLLIEVESRHVPAWGRLIERELPRLNLLRIETRPGVPHPTQGVPRGEVVQ